MGKILNLGILLAFVAAVIAGDADDNMDVITASNFHKFLTPAESGHNSVRAGRGYQDQAFIVGSRYKVSDGILDGSFGGVTHTAKGVVLGYDHEGPHHITSLSRGKHHKQNLGYYQSQPQQAPAYKNQNYQNYPYGYNFNYPKKYEAVNEQKYAYYGHGSKHGGGYGGQGRGYGGQGRGYGQTGDYGYGYDSPAYTADAAAPEYGQYGQYGQYGGPATGNQRSVGYNDGIGGIGSLEQSPKRPVSYNKGVAKVFHSGNHLDGLRAIYGQNSYAYEI